MEQRKPTPEQAARLKAIIDKIKKQMKKQMKKQAANTPCAVPEETLAGTVSQAASLHK